MIHDNLIDTIIKRAENYMNAYDCINACKYYERALRRIFNTIEEEKMKKMEEYTNKYEIDFFISNVIGDYLVSLDDCFNETGEKFYLEKIIEFKEKYVNLFEVGEYIYCAILRAEIEAKFYLGEKEEALKMYEKLTKEYPKDDCNYFNMSRLYYESGNINKAIEILKCGIKNCEMGTEDMSDRLYMYEEEMKESK